MENYEIIKKIGQGKFANVFRARRLQYNPENKNEEEIIALKKISANMMDEKARNKCLKEVRLLEQLDHENIIKYYDSFIYENELIIIIEWAEAGDLKRQIRKMQERRRRYEERVVWRFFHQIAAAIQHMHSRRILHRDLKPANILLTLDGTVKVSDLGLSRSLSEDTYQAHSKVGTPLYMAPEVLGGQSGYDWKSDIWSLGCLLYELAQLRSPFKSQGLNLYGLFEKINRGDYPPLPDYYSNELKELAYQMISVLPEDRPDIDTVCDVANRMYERTKNIVPDETPPPYEPLPKTSEKKKIKENKDDNKNDENNNNKKKTDEDFINEMKRLGRHDSRANKRRNDNNDNDNNNDDKKKKNRRNSNSDDKLSDKKRKKIRFSDNDNNSDSDDNTDNDHNSDYKRNKNRKEKKKKSIQFNDNNNNINNNKNKIKLNDKKITRFNDDNDNDHKVKFKKPDKITFTDIDDITDDDKRKRKNKIKSTPRHKSKFKELPNKTNKKILPKKNKNSEAQKLSQHTTSGVIMKMDLIDSYLTTLGYRSYRSKDLHPILPNHFSCDLSNSLYTITRNQQFHDFCYIIHWFLMELDPISATKFDISDLSTISPQQLATQVLTSLNNIDLPPNLLSSISPSSLLSGHGMNVCIIILSLCEKLWDERKPSTELIYDDENFINNMDDNDMDNNFNNNNNDDDDDDDDDIIEEDFDNNFNSDSDDDNYNNDTSQSMIFGKEELYFQESETIRENRRIFYTKVEQHEWIKELERVGPKLKRRNNIKGYESEWSLHLDNILKNYNHLLSYNIKNNSYINNNKNNDNNTNIKLDLISSIQNILKDLNGIQEKVQREENLINKNYNIDKYSSQYKEYDLLIKDYTKEYEEDSKKLQENTKILHELEDEEDKIKEAMESRDENSGTNNIVEMRKAISDIKEEILQLETQIAIVGVSLLNQEIRIQNDNKKSRKKKKKNII